MHLEIIHPRWSREGSPDPNYRWSLYLIFKNVVLSMTKRTSSTFWYSFYIRFLVYVPFSGKDF